MKCDLCPEESDAIHYHYFIPLGKDASGKEKYRHRWVCATCKGKFYDPNEDHEDN